MSMNLPGGEKTTDFVIKKTLTSPEAVSLLIETFPWLPNAVGEELDPAESHYVYARFADEIQRRQNDESFLRQACDFVSHLAEVHDSFLTDILVTSFFESVAYDRTLATRMKPCLSPTANDLLEAVERHLL